MKSLRFTAIGVLLAAASTAAMAFQEQRQGAAPEKSAPAEQSEAVPGAGLAGVGEPVAKPTGTEIRIPGLGSLGVLPKMDFGLELLYGASEQKLDDNRAIAPNSDDLAIRGTIKKRF